MRLKAFTIYTNQSGNHICLTLNIFQTIKERSTISFFYEPTQSVYYKQLHCLSNQNAPKLAKTTSKRKTLDMYKRNVCAVCISYMYTDHLPSLLHRESTLRRFSFRSWNRLIVSNSHGVFVRVIIPETQKLKLSYYNLNSVY